MPITNNLTEAIKSNVTNFTCNGKCSNCGQCCSDFLPVSESEIIRIKKYIKQKGIKESKHIPIISNTMDFTCPFRDNENKKCLIYEVRPEICRRFICSKSMPEIEDAKKLCEKTREMVSMRNIFFDGEPLQFILFKIAKKLVLEKESK